MREYLHDLRKSKKLTMKEVAAQLGISESYYCQIENGGRQEQMSIPLATALSAVFEVPIAEIIANETSD